MNFGQAELNKIKGGIAQGYKNVVSFGGDILRQTINDSGSTFLGFALQNIAKKFTVFAIAENAITSRGIALKNNVPSYTVEKGVDMSERIKRLPITISQTFTTGDFYIPKSKSTIGSFAPDIAAKALLTLSNSEVLNGVQNAVISNVLRNVFEKKQLLTLYTSIGIYENMAIESLSIRHSPGNTLEFDITFREIMIADESRITIVDGGGSLAQNIVNNSNVELAALIKDRETLNVNVVADPAITHSLFNVI